MFVLADNDVGGAVAVLRRILESAENAVSLKILIRSRAAMLMNTVPVIGGLLNAASWLLANAAGKSMAIPIPWPIRWGRPPGMNTRGFSLIRASSSIS